MKQMNKYILGKITYRYEKENQRMSMFVVEKACLSKCMGEDWYGERMTAQKGIVQFLHKQLRILE